MEKREIKFRAWDKIGKRMLPDSEISRDTDGGWFIWDEDDNSQDDNFELMQYTGLKDKNGKEIYEGDIIYKDDKQTWTVEYALFGEPMFGVFNQLNSCRDIEVDEFGAYFIAVEDIIRIEVIGNIYENPELLDNN